MAKKPEPETIDPNATYRVELSRPIRVAGIAMHPNDPDVTVSGAVLETILQAVDVLCEGLSPMRRFDRYRVADDDEVQAGYFNGVHEDLDLRLHAVEEKAVGWDEEVANFEDVALGRDRRSASTDPAASQS